MESSTKENTVPHALSPSVVSDHERAVTIEPEPLWQENDAATQVPSQDSEDKTHRSDHGISNLVRVATETFIAMVHIDAFPFFKFFLFPLAPKSTLDTV